MGSDHAGFSLKQFLLVSLEKEFPHLKFEDCGCYNDEPVDYPDVAKTVAEKVGKGEGSGILICGSGIGQSISANKIKGVRAAVVWNGTAARLSRQHNDANVLCMGARLLGSEVALEAAKIWLATPFEGGRHEKRLALIRKIEEGNV